tara:strand:- start:426 stop:749 length:324 start_codon:yes stop_codon:yes gene_type:complete
MRKLSADANRQTVPISAVRCQASESMNTTARRAESNATPCTFNLAMSARASTLGSRIFRPSLLAKGLRSIEFETTNCCQRGLGKISLLGIPVVSNSRFAPEAHGFFY